MFFNLSIMSRIWSTKDQSFIHLTKLYWIPPRHHQFIRSWGYGRNKTEIAQDRNCPYLHGKYNSICRFQLKRKLNRVYNECYVGKISLQFWILCKNILLNCHGSHILSSCLPWKLQKNVSEITCLLTFSK